MERMSGWSGGSCDPLDLTTVVKLISTICTLVTCVPVPQCRAKSQSSIVLMVLLTALGLKRLKLNTPLVVALMQACSFESMPTEA